MLKSRKHQSENDQFGGWINQQWCRKVKKLGLPVVIGKNNLPSPWAPVGIGYTNLPNIRRGEGAERPGSGINKLIKDKILYTILCIFQNIIDQIFQELGISRFFWFGEWLVDHIGSNSHSNLQSNTFFVIHPLFKISTLHPLFKILSFLPFSRLWLAKTKVSLQLFASFCKFNEGLFWLLILGRQMA